MTSALAIALSDYPMCHIAKGVRRSMLPFKAAFCNPTAAIPSSRWSHQLLFIQLQFFNFLPFTSGSVVLYPCHQRRSTGRYTWIVVAVKLFKRKNSAMVFSQLLHLIARTWCWRMFHFFATTLSIFQWSVTQTRNSWGTKCSEKMMRTNEKKQSICQPKQQLCKNKKFTGIRDDQQKRETQRVLLRAWTDIKCARIFKKIFGICCGWRHTKTVTLRYALAESKIILTNVQQAS